MGVINLTPNSFRHISQVTSRQDLFDKLKYLKKIDCWIDIGAESTAPHNQAISAQEEIERFEIFFDLIQNQKPILPKVISIDTYRLETIEAVASRLSKIDRSIRLIWNDISGLFDQSTVDLLNKFPKLSYVYCQNFAKSREIGAQHLHYVRDELTETAFFDEIINDFKLTLKAGEKYNLASRIILDPCFGFAKNREQNWMLIRMFPRLVELLNHHTWLVGISGKSFLKLDSTADINQTSTARQVDMLQFTLFSHWFKSMPSCQLIARVHRVEDVIDLNQFHDLYF